MDLAGSERVAKTGSEGLLLREAGAINKSLALLEQVGKSYISFGVSVCVSVCVRQHCVCLCASRGGSGRPQPEGV